MLASYARVVAALEALARARAAYLEAKGWERKKNGRWLKSIPWGSSSERLVEADLVDAVRYQAMHDGDIERG